MQIVVFLIDSRPYGLPLEAVEQVLPMVEISLLPAAPEVLLGVIDYHGEILPVVDLRARLKLSRRELELQNRLLVVRTTRRRLALVADAVAGVREVLPEAVHDPAGIDPTLRHVAGIATLEDGLVVIQDLETLLSADEEQVLCQALPERVQ
jgi:purine-binding chemotaxis protein CheW